MVRPGWVFAIVTVAVAGCSHTEGHTPLRRTTSTHAATTSAVAPDLDNALAQKTARDFLNAFTNYSYTTVDHDLAAVAALSTDKFATEYSQAATTLRSTLVATQATSRGMITSLDSQLPSPGNCNAEATVNQTMTGLNHKIPEVDRSDIKIVLRYSPEGWRIADVTVSSRTKVAG